MFDAKQNYRYEIQYYFIPELVEVVSKRILPSAVFTMFDIWERILKDKYGSDFKLEQGYDCKEIKINDRYALYFFTFPEPDCCPEALYGAVVVDNQEDTLQYYTLEMSFNGRWVIGSKTQDRHYNYGELDSRNPEAFIDWLSNKLK
jgi:hypothetical protein